MHAEYSQLWREHDAKVRPYLWCHRAVGWARRLVGLGFVAWLVLEGRGQWMEWVLNPVIASPFGLWLAFFGAIGLGWELVSFPFSVAAFAVEKRFGLSRQGVGSWLWDRAKGLLLGAVLGALALGIVYVSVAGFGARWWLACSIFFLLFSIVLAQLAPVLLIPLFFKLEPMAAGPLKERLLRLSSQHGIDVKDVYHLGLGEKTEKGNAAFVGLGRTKRILIGDTLYKKFSLEQVEAVFAHELGHQVHNDLWRGIAFSSVTTILAFGVADALAGGLLPDLGTSLERPFGMLVFFVLLSVVQLPLGVVHAVYSRSREWGADRFASKTIGLAAPLADALEQLTLQNWGQFRPNPVVEFLTFSHPAPGRRILRLRTGGAS